MEKRVRLFTASATRRWVRERETVHAIRPVPSPLIFIPDSYKLWFGTSEAQEVLHLRTSVVKIIWGP